MLLPGSWHSPAHSRGTEGATWGNPLGRFFPCRYSAWAPRNQSVHGADLHSLGLYDHVLLSLFLVSLSLIWLLLAFCWGLYDFPTWPGSGGVCS